MSYQNPPSKAVSRRDFLTLSGMVPALLIAQSIGNRAAAAPSTAAPLPLPTRNAGKIPIGLELFSVRNELNRDLSNTLREVAKIGYETVEFYAPYFDWAIPRAKEVRRL